MDKGVLMFGIISTFTILMSISKQINWIHICEVGIKNKLLKLLNGRLFHYSLLQILHLEQTIMGATSHLECLQRNFHSPMEHCAPDGINIYLISEDIPISMISSVDIYISILLY